MNPMEHAFSLVTESFPGDVESAIMCVNLNMQADPERAIYWYTVGIGVEFWRKELERAQA